MIATWDLTEFGVPRNEPASEANSSSAQGNSLHSISVADDGGRVWLAQMDAGFLILDSTRIAAQRRATSLTSAPAIPASAWSIPTSTRAWTPRHPARQNPQRRQDPGKDVIILTHEVLGSGSCPWHWVRFVDIRFETLPSRCRRSCCPRISRKTARWSVPLPSRLARTSPPTTRHPSRTYCS
jgi:hypothetical protein